MRKIKVFNHLSIDGYFTDQNNDMSWAHKQNIDAEWNEFVNGNASGKGTLMFGRVTYEMMASFWPTPMAQQMMPQVAAAMNAMPKFVCSRTLSEATWQNSTLLRGDLIEQVRQLKQQPGTDIVIMGSGSVIAQLAQAGLIDEYQLVINPVVLGKGRTLFEGVTSRPNLKLTQSRTFQNGSVVLWYAAT
jgi:dihydrofolate reductase